MTLSGGHLSVDFASGAVPALLPFLTDEFDLSYTRDGGLMLAVLVSSSLVQPLFGLWSDRRGAMWLLPGGVALAGIGIGLAAVAPTYPLVVALVLRRPGSGIAAYHPEGAKFAAYASGRKRASGMSLLQHRRELGLRARADPDHAARASGSASAGGLLAMVPVVVVLARPAAGAAVPAAARARRDRRAAWRSARTTPGRCSCSSLVIGLRSVAWFALLAFVPLWVVANGGTEAEGGPRARADAACPARSGRSCSGRSPTASGCGARCS